MSLEIITSGLMIYLIILKAQKNCDCSREIFPRLPLLHIALLSEQLTPQEGTAVELGTAGLSTAAGGASTTVLVGDSGYLAPHSSGNRNFFSLGHSPSFPTESMMF